MNGVLGRDGGNPMGSGDVAMGGYSGHPQQSQQQHHKRRNRVRFSCNNCRDKKLKCSRGLPCDQCQKRNLDTVCHYEPYTAYSGGGGSISITAQPLFRRHHSAIDKHEFRNEFQHEYHLEYTRSQQQQQTLTAATTTPTTSGHSRNTSIERQTHPNPQPQTQTQLDTPLTDPRFNQPRTPLSHNARNHSVPERLKYLEQLVQFLQARQDGSNGQQTSHIYKDNGDVNARASGGQDEEAPNVDAVELRYTDPANWEGVLDDIVNLTNRLGPTDDIILPASQTRWSFGPMSTPSSTNSTTTGPALFQMAMPSSDGTPSPTFAAGIFRFLPPKPVVDLFVRLFFGVAARADPTTLHVMFHQPTFHQQYEAFWGNTSAASLPYLAMLFGIMGHAALSSARTRNPVTAGLDRDPWVIVDACRQRAAQALALDNYSRPGQYKIEALVLYFCLEYNWCRHLCAGATTTSSSALTPTVMILSIAIRLAMHTGYHRDPSHYGGQLFAFDGEMQRRTWAVLSALDKTVCYELGLPTTINYGSSGSPSDSDVQMPRNLYDSDLARDMPTLPPARPETERTPLLYTLARARLLSVLTDMMQLRQQANTVDASNTSAYPIPTPPSDNVMADNLAASASHVKNLDRQLDIAYFELPLFLRLRGASEREALDLEAAIKSSDPVDLCIERYIIEILYQRSRLVLHRRFQGIERGSKRHAYSRWVCTDAAVRLLRHQYDLYVAMQPASKDGNGSTTEPGRLSAYRWLLADSSTTHDFLLADTVLCLEVSYLTRRSTGVNGDLPATHNASDDHGAVASLPQLLGLLQTSRSIWATLQGTSTEAQQAYSILTRVLKDAKALDVENDAQNNDEDMDIGEPVSPTVTTSTGQSGLTRLSGMTGLSCLSAMTATSMATTTPTQSTLSIPLQSSSSSITAIPTNATPARAVPMFAASCSTAREPVEPGGGTLHGKYSKDALGTSTATVSPTDKTATQPLPLNFTARHLPQATGIHPLSQLTSSEHMTPLWPVPVPPGGLVSPVGGSALPVLLDMDITTASSAVGYGIPAQPPLNLHPPSLDAMAPAAVSHGLPSGLLSDISAPLQFPAGTSSLTGIAGNVTDLPNLDNEPMQGLADVYTGDWNLWRDQHQNGLPGDWNNFFGRHESTDNA